MKEMTVKELKQKLDNGEDLVVIDVRETHEYEEANIGAKHIPLMQLLSDPAEIPHDKPVVIHCRSGARSASVIAELERRHNYSNLYNLKGGILAWANEVDPSLSK